MSISSALSSECEEKQLLVHQTSGTTIVSMEELENFATHCPSNRTKKTFGGTSLSDHVIATGTSISRGSMTSVESASSGGIGTCSLNSHSTSSRQCSHSPSGSFR